MIRRASHRPVRRGAVLLVVLGLLALFAVVGLSFVMLAETEATGMRNYRSSRNEIADPDPTTAANAFLAQLLFDADATSPLWGHSLARSRFGPVGTQSPFTGAGFPFGTSVTLNGATMDQTQVVNYSAASAFGGPNPDAWNKAVPWTYPDRNNFWLAYHDPASDTVTLPSFHRPDLFGVLDSSNPNWTNADGRFKTLRPRPQEHPAFPRVPANADGTFTGDVANLKWLTGSVKNDSLWLDPNLPIKEWRGRRYKTLVAPLILDLSGKVNLSVAGNNRNGGGHGSHHGWGAWEVNPSGVLGGGAADTAALTNLRYTGANPAGAAQPLDRFRTQSNGTLNGGLMPPQTSRIDAAGASTAAADPMTLPGPGGFYPFPSYSARFAANQAGLNTQLAATHGQSFSPYQWPRRQTPTSGSPWLASLEDEMRLSLPSRMMKGTSGYNGQFTPNSRLTTHFSVSQRWGEIAVRTGPNATDLARLTAIDLTRPLADYRTSAAGPLSPRNLGNLVVARIARQNLARDIFVRLMAVNNMIDGTNVAYNPTTGYLSVGAGTPPATVTGLRFWAQVAANVVDQIDHDDIVTAFVWNPIDPTQADVNGDINNFNVAAALPNRVVYGTELPRLVVNEAYCALTGTPRDSPPWGPPLGKGMGAVNRPQDGAQKAYWLELHNPVATDPTLPDVGAARLEYDPAVTQVFDGLTNAMAPYLGGRYAAYEIEVADVAAGMGNQTPYTAYLAGNPLGHIGDTPTTMAMTPKLQIRDYTHYNGLGMGMSPVLPAAQPADDTQKVVVPANGGNAGNGYFVVGPRADFPTPGVALNLRVADPPGMPMPGALINALSFDTNARTAADINTQLQTTSVVLLRRLVNPYLPPQLDPTQPGYNPYMTVDYLENIPTRDRAGFDNNGPRAGWMASTLPTVGRKHPYAAAPAYNPAAVAAPFPAVVDQVNAAVVANPPHTLGAANSPLDNAAGLAWLAHLDREPVNVLELLSTSVWSAAQLTQKFYSGAVYQGHTHPLQTGTPALIDSTTYPTAFRALDLFGTSSRLPGVPLGGREPGLVNLNTAGDAAILQAVLDPQTGNNFNAAFVGTAWAALLPTRTPGNNGSGSYNLPAATAAEGGTDRPFQPFAAFQETLFRQGAVPGYPAIFTGGAHQYVQSEPLRKGWNNLTTVSDGFLVVFTVGFFEVDAANRLGRELFDKVNGDLRAQFAGIVDRSAITLPIDPNTLAVQTPNLAVNPATPAALGPKPWETKLAADSLSGSNTITIQALPGAVGSNVCTVFNDGIAVTIDPTVTTPTANRVRDLWVGYAMANPSTAGFATNPYPAGTADGDGEAVRVTAVTPGTVAGTAVLTVTPAGGGALRRFHGGGTRVSNAPVGHPGPQPTFDYRDTTGRYSGVLPYFMKVEP